MFHYHENKRKKYFSNLNKKDITANKKLWQTIKPFLSEKTKLREKITLIEVKNLVSDDVEVSNCVNNFFSNIVKNFEIPKHGVEDDLHVNMNSHPTFKQFLSMKTIQVLFPSGVFVIKFQTLNLHQ